MEIFIVGIIVVALMVYASTKMKKFTASAFERETIETEDFSLIKPEGFLHVIGDESEFAFYAYSKEFGKVETEEEMRQAEIFIQTFVGKTLAEVCNGIKTGAEKVISFSDAKNVRLIETEETIKDVVVSEIYKIVEDEKIYQLKISVLKDFKDDYKEQIDEILRSFQVR